MLTISVAVQTVYVSSDHVYFGLIGCDGTVSKTLPSIAACIQCSLAACFSSHRAGTVVSNGTTAGSGCQQAQSHGGLVSVSPPS